MLVEPGQFSLKNSVFFLLRQDSSVWSAWSSMELELLLVWLSTPPHEGSAECLSGTPPRTLEFSVQCFPLLCPLLQLPFTPCTLSCFLTRFLFPVMGLEALWSQQARQDWVYFLYFLSLSGHCPSLSNVWYLAIIYLFCRFSWMFQKTGGKFYTLFYLAESQSTVISLLKISENTTSTKEQGLY